VITDVFSVEMVEFSIKDKSNHKISNLAFLLVVPSRMVLEWVLNVNKN